VIDEKGKIDLHREKALEQESIVNEKDKLVGIKRSLVDAQKNEIENEIGRVDPFFKET